MDFNQIPVSIKFDSLNMNFFYTNSTFSDSEGNLLFYSNGIYVANSSDKTLENGDSLNLSFVDTVYDTTIFHNGYRLPQGILSLQSLSNPGQYYLISSLLDTLPNSNESEFYVSKVLISLIDMSANGGQGRVIYKNQALVEDTLSESLQCVRHGNGRDWWILIQKRNTNCFYRVLFDTAGFHVMVDMVCTGDTIHYDQLDASCFTPDGTKYIYLASYSGLNIYDFDRCTGLLSNPRNFPLPIIADSDWGAFGVAVSPNSRFLYTSITHQLYQFDLSDNDIFSTIDTVGIYDGGHLPNRPSIQSIFYMAQLAPDGKIYIAADDVPYYHVINSPDEKGSLCNFSQNGIKLPTVGNCVPNFPNFRLGSLTQSQCDSLATLTQDLRDFKERILNVFPNPSRDIVNVDYGYVDWTKGPVNLQITNELGLILFNQSLPIYSGYQYLDISRFVSGIYTIYLKRGGAIVAASKFVKQ